jgi:hypothetical protein
MNVMKLFHFCASLRRHLSAVTVPRSSLVSVETVSFAAGVATDVMPGGEQCSETVPHFV